MRAWLKSIFEPKTAPKLIEIEEFGEWKDVERDFNMIPKDRIELTLRDREGRSLGQFRIEAVNHASIDIFFRSVAAEYYERAA